MNNTKVLVLRGIAGSGKSTWAKEQVSNGGGKWKRVNKDDLRAMVDCGQYSKENEKIIENIRDKIIEECLKKNINVIVDDTNLSERHLTTIQSIIGQYNLLFPPNNKKLFREAEIEIKWFPITLDEALYRNNTRPKEEKIPEKVLCEMYRKYIKIGGPLPNPPPIYNPELPDAIICDLDGTLFSFFSIKGGIRGPFEQEKCNEDMVVEPVANVLFSQNKIGNKIILTSGRFNTYREQTIEALERENIIYDYLFMRDKDDTRGDDIVKEDLYNKYIKDKFNIIFVLDDRLKVIRKWKELGLTVFNVGSSIEF